MAISEFFFPSNLLIREHVFHKHFLHEWIFLGCQSGRNLAKNKHCSEVFSHFIFPAPQFSCLLFFQNSKRLLTGSK
jgi:hypothetical protein